MFDEKATLQSTGIWDLVALHHGKSPVGCRWVYTVKIGSNGRVDCLKACLVAKGYTQIYGYDYYGIFSHITKIALIRLLLSTTAMSSWPLLSIGQQECLSSWLSCRRGIYGATTRFYCSVGVWFSM